MAGGVSLPAQYCADIPYTESGGKLTVTASVNGKTGRFIFDTGAPCTLTHSFAEGMELPEIGSVRTIDANGRTAENGVVEIESLSPERSPPHRASTSRGVRSGGESTYFAPSKSGRS